MKVPVGLSVGVCTHTGLVRGGNEDDYLLAMPPDGNAAFLAAVADGMGGVAGGAEASRTALRALSTAVLDESAGGNTDSGGSRQRMLDGFRAANARVLEAATAVHALRDMGTTLTALWLSPNEAVVGHIGDSRLYRLRGDECEAMTIDHSVKQGKSLLTRCIGGGQLECEADEQQLDIAAGDRFVLCTDGLWNVVAEEPFLEAASARGAQEAAELLVKRALDAGAPDNATVLVVDVLDPDLGGGAPAAEPVAVDLPRHERPDPRSLWPQSVSLRPPIWAWLLFGSALLLLIYSGLRWAGLDVLAGI